MESSNNSIDPENEVKKLQELVKKLEKQNEVLRGKQKPSSPMPNGESASFVTRNANSYQTQTESSSAALSLKPATGGLDEVDVLDVDNISLKDEEDSWLYSSPKPPTPQQSNINLYKWVRQDFDHPSPEVESARRSLLSKLDEAARMNRSCSTPALGGTTSPTKGLSLLSRSTDDAHRQYSGASEESSKYSRPHQRRSLLAAAGSRIGNGTFTRPKKSLEKDRGEENAYHQHEGTDVEKLARQQEESLRQSMATYTSPKRVLQNKSMSLASDTDNSGSPAGSNRSSPSRYDFEGSYMGRHQSSFGSDGGTPPDSPYNFPQNSTPYSDQTPQGRSVANMSRLQYPPPSSHSSDSSLEHQSAGSTDDLNLAPETRSTSRLTGPGFRSASPAAGGLRPGVANSHGQGPSPQRSGLPAPRRGIPRPSSAVRSSLPMPRRSGIPSPRPYAQEKDDSWRDGCF